MSDHSALRHVLGLKDPHGRLARWSIYLSQFDFTVIYRTGRKHTNCDVLSRNPLPDTIPEKQDSDLEDVLSAESLIPLFPSISPLKEEQEKDAFCIKVRNRMKEGDKFAKSFRMNDENILEKIITTPNGRIHAIVLPTSLQNFAISQCHDPPEAGHQGFARTASRVMSRFYAPHLLTAIRDYVSSCPLCQKRKTPPILKHSECGELPTSTVPFDIICCDLMGPLNTTHNGNKHIVVIIDVATRFIETCPVKSTTSDMTIKVLTDQIFFRHGIPSIIITDRGTNFTSDLFKKTMNSYKIKHHLTTSFNPRANGITERMNKTLGTSLAMYCHTFPTNWDDLLGKVTFAINTSVNDITHFSPFQLLHFRQPTLPIHRLLELPSSPFFTTDIKKIEEIRELVQQRIRDAQEKNKRMHKKHFSTPSFAVGDQVLLYKPLPVPGIPKKFQLKYRGPYVIVSKLKDTPSFEIKNLSTGLTEFANSRNLRSFNERKAVHFQEDLRVFLPEDASSSDEDVNPTFDLTLPSSNAVTGQGIHEQPAAATAPILQSPENVETGVDGERRYPYRARKQYQRYQATFT